ncbi:MAG: hypothetical protein ACOY71_03810 [Gemmatimonadota bacterium]
MPPETIGTFIPVLALLIPVLGLTFFGLVKLQRLKLEEQQLRLGRGGPGLEHRLAVLEEQLDAVRREVAETQERLDFAERLLAQRAPDRLNEPR